MVWLGYISLFSSHHVHFWDILDEEGRSQDVSHTVRESWTRRQGEGTVQRSHLNWFSLSVVKLVKPTKAVELVEKSRMAGKERGKVNIEILLTHPLYSCLQTTLVCRLSLKPLRIEELSSQNSKGLICKILGLCTFIVCLCNEMAARSFLPP